MSTLAERIRLVRKDHGLSQAEFAQRLRITRGHVSKLEIGQATPSEQLLALIELNFNLNWDWLETGEGDVYLAPHLDAVERDRQMKFYELLRDHVEIFLLQYGWMRSLLVENLKQANDLTPDLCPPELLEGMRKILKIPDGELFQLLRDRFLTWADEEPY